VEDIVDIRLKSKKERSFALNRVFFFSLALALLPAFSLNAQFANDLGETITSYEDEVTRLVERDFPEQRISPLPQSSTNRATLGTIDGDPDKFMSVHEFGTIGKMENQFVLAGVDEYGLVIGYSRKIGSLYIGGSYSGSLINELFQRVTNQDILTLSKHDELTENDVETSLRDQDNKTPSGETVSNNDINIILGKGIFGIRLGFSEYLRGFEDRRKSNELNVKDTSTFESSFKPTLELGLNIPAGSVKVKPALRAAFDIHQYISNTKWDRDYTLSVIDPLTAVTTSTQNRYTIGRRFLMDYMEPSGGFSLGLDFGNSEHIRAEASFGVDVAYRIYKTNDKDGGWITYAVNGTTAVLPAPSAPVEFTREFLAPDIFDLRLTGTPSFVFAADMTPKFTLGFEVKLNFGYGLLQITQTDNAVAFDNGAKTYTPLMEWTNSDTVLSASPDLGLGVSYRLIPDHFALHAGLGIVLFSYREVKTEYTVTDIASGASVDDTRTTKDMYLPSTRLGAGLTLNFTETVAIDLMAIMSGLSFDATKITALVTVKQ
jgi:hypothetical protein